MFDWLFDLFRDDDLDLYGDIADAFAAGELDEDEALALRDEYYPEVEGRDP